jgi:hypothetical protein
MCSTTSGLENDKFWIGCSIGCLALTAAIEIAIFFLEILASKAGVFGDLCWLK